jgi:hypothetical protein
LFSADAGRNVYCPMIAVFTGLAAGSHNVEMWTRIPNSAASNVSVNPGNYSERVIVDEQ